MEIFGARCTGEVTHSGINEITKCLSDCAKVLAPRTLVSTPVRVDEWRGLTPAFLASADCHARSWYLDSGSVVSLTNNKHALSHFETPGATVNVFDGGTVELEGHGSCEFRGQTSEGPQIPLESRSLLAELSPRLATSESSVTWVAEFCSTNLVP